MVSFDESVEGGASPLRLRLVLKLDDDGLLGEPNGTGTSELLVLDASFELDELPEAACDAEADSRAALALDAVVELDGIEPAFDGVLPLELVVSPSKLRGKLSIVPSAPPPDRACASTGAPAAVGAPEGD